MGAAVRCAQRLDRLALRALDDRDIELAYGARALAKEGYSIAKAFERWPVDTASDPSQRDAEVLAFREWEARSPRLLDGSGVL